MEETLNILECVTEDLSVLWADHDKELGAMKLELELAQHDKTALSNILIETSDRLRLCEERQGELHAELEYKRRICQEVTEQYQTYQRTVNHSVVETGRMVRRHVEEQAANIRVMPYNHSIYQPPYPALPDPSTLVTPPMSPVQSFPVPPFPTPLLPSAPYHEFTYGDFDVDFGPDMFTSSAATFYQ